MFRNFIFFATLDLPSILPLFPGLNTHKKILVNGIKIHGSTVHIVNEKLDSGKILGQFAFAVENNDLNFLKDNIKKYENLLYPEVIKKYIWTFLFKEDKFLKNKNFPNKFIVSFGYTGWSSGQLEKEIQQGSWVIIPANEQIIFSTKSDKKVEEASKLAGFNLDLVSNHYGKA